MRNFRFLGTTISALLILVLGIFLNIPPARAATTPTLSVSGNSSTVQITVHGDAYSNIQMGYYAPGSSSPVNIGLIGITDGYGNFTASLSYGAYGIPGWSTVYVTVNGVNSTGAAWPGSGSSGTLILSQTYVTVNTGQNTTITSSNGYNLTASSNNNSVVSVSPSYNQVTIYGLTTGSAVVTICSSNAGCANVNVTVSNSSGTLVLSQTNVTLSLGQSTTITSSNGTNLTASSNSSIVNTSVANNQVTITSAVVGTATVTICSSNAGCGTVNVTVQNSSSNLILSQTNVTLNAGQNVTIASSNGVNLTATTNNSGIASASTNYNQVTVYGVAYGTATINVCSSNAGCTNVNVTVNNTTNNLNLSQTNVNLTIGQSTTVTSYNGTNLTVSSNNSNVANAWVNNNQISIYGASNGSATITVCSSNVGCANVNVTVSNTTNNLNLSQTYVTLNAGQSTLITSSNGYNLTAWSNNTGVASVNTSASAREVSIYGISKGTATITVCSSNAGCVNVNVTVNNYSTGTLTLSQTNVTLTTDQSITITSSNGTNLTATTNNSMVTVSNWNNQITIKGVSTGTSIVTVCSGNVGCANVYITVNKGTTGNHQISQTNLNLTSGQSVVITSANGTSLSATPNNSNVTASTNWWNNLITITGVSTGSSVVAVCSDNVGCTNVYVSVNGAAVTGNTFAGNTLTLNQSNVTLAVGQSSTLTVQREPSYSGYSITSNSSPNVVSATVQGNSINVKGLSVGSSILTVCANSNYSCGTITITVNGSISLSQKSLTLNNTSPRQTVTIYGNGPFSLTGNTNPSVVAATLNSDNTLSLSATGYGIATIMVCQTNNSSACASISVNTRSVSSKKWFKRQAFKPAR